MKYLPKPAGIRPYLDMLEGYERFVMTAIAGVINTGLLVAGYIDQTTYATLTTATVAVFIGANAYTHGVTIKQEAQVTMSAAVATSADRNKDMLDGIPTR